jgi:condensin complex subunit 2
MSPEAHVPEEVVRPKKGSASINMPKKDWKTKSRNLLPDDRHFNSRQLKRLFLKPKASLYSAKPSRGGANANGGPGGIKAERPNDMDEEFWSRDNMAKEIQASSSKPTPLCENPAS